MSEVAARIQVDCPEHASTQALLVGSALLLRGELDEGAAALRRVVVPEPSSTDPRAWISAAAAALYLGDEDAAQARYGRAVDILRAQGAIGELPYALCLTAAMDLASAATATPPRTRRSRCASPSRRGRRPIAATS